MRFSQWDDEHEISTFIEAVFEAVTGNRQSGDLLSSVLINPEFTRAKVIFQRDEGKGKTILVNLETKIDENGVKVWYVDGNAKEK